jgi:methylmalonyl-CoA/ethylmalonyl-CoA epimerase
VSPVEFHHLAIGAARLTDAPPLLVGVLGGLPDADRVLPRFAFACWRFAGGGRIEVLEPRGSADGFLHRFLAARGPGIHHVTFKVPSLREACARATRLGYQVVGLDASRLAWQEAFLHPKDAQGIVVQMVESVGPDRPRAWQGPPAPPDPPPPVTIVGLRLRARSAERAHRQWAGILGGEAAADGDATLVVRWPGSPMRLAVDVDPTGDEGPVCVEVAADRPLALAPGPDPGLGAVFVQRGPAAVS